MMIRVGERKDRARGNRRVNTETVFLGIETKAQPRVNIIVRKRQWRETMQNFSILRFSEPILRYIAINDISRWSGINYARGEGIGEGIRGVGRG